MFRVRLAEAIDRMRSGKRIRSDDWAPSPRPQPFTRDEDEVVGQRPHEGVLADVLLALNLRPPRDGLGALFERAQRAATKAEEREALIALAAAAMERAAHSDWREG